MAAPAGHGTTGRGEAGWLHTWRAGPGHRLRPGPASTQAAHGMAPGHERLRLGAGLGAGLRACQSARLLTSGHPVGQKAGTPTPWTGMPGWAGRAGRRAHLVREGAADLGQVVRADGHQGALPAQVLVQLVLPGVRAATCEGCMGREQNAAQAACCQAQDLDALQRQGVVGLPSAWRNCWSSRTTGLPCCCRQHARSGQENAYECA